MLSAKKFKVLSNFGFFYSFAGNGIFLVFALSIITGVLDVLGISFLIPLLQLSDGVQVLNDEMNEKASFFLDLLSSLNIEFNIYTVLALLIIIFCLKGGFVYLSFYTRAKVRRRLIKGIRFKLTDGLSNFKYDKFTEMNVGQMNSSFTTEVGLSSSAFDKYLMSIYQLMMVFAYLVMTILIDYKITAIILLTVSPIFLLFRYLNRLSKELSQDIKDEERGLNHALLQSLVFFKYLKATSTFLKHRKILRFKADFIENLQFKIGVLRGKLNASKEIFVVIFVSILILVQVLVFKESISAILLILVLLYRNFGAFMVFQNSWQGYMSVLGSLEGVKETLQLMEEGQEDVVEKQFEGDIETISCDKVSFSYGESKIIKDLSFEIKKNRTVAFVGESGSGKSTIINLLIGLLKPTGGSVKVNDNDLNEIDKNSYRKKLGFITQEPVIFSESVYENVTLTKEKSSELLERFWKVCRDAHIATHIQSLPNKEDTELGDFGVTLSGGQRQRISIARELFREPKILIMDEATSSLDSETEEIIHSNIDLLKGKVTIILIAHRLSTIKNADEVFLINAGELEDVGTFEQLMSSNKRFKRMLYKQGV